MENGKPKSVLIGTVEKYLTRADAERAIEHHRIKINTKSAQQQFHSVTVGALADRFMAEEMPARVREDTAKTYQGLLRNWVRPRWGAEFLQNVKTLAVEHWLKNVPRSASTKAHIRNLMHLLFNCAIRWELVEKNPIDLVRQSGKRSSVPRIFTPEEFRKLLDELKQPYRTIVLVAGCLGLRISEILGLRWGDIDWENLNIMVQRSVVLGKVYETKTEASRKPMPIDPKIAEVLLTFRRQAVYVGENDYIFAGESGSPRWQATMLADYVT